MARGITSGFEVYVSASETPGSNVPDGALLGVSNATATRDTSIKRSGRASLKIITTSAAGLGYNAWHSVSSFDFFCRAYFRVSRPSAECCIMRIRASGNNISEVRLNTDGTIELWVAVSGVGLQLQGSASVVALDDNTSWYRVELYTLQSASAGQDLAELRLDGVTVATWQGTLTETIGPNEFHTGWVTTPGATSKTIYVDDVALNYDSGSDQSSWPGPGNVVMLLPESDSQVGSWTAGAGGTSSLFDAVNNTPPIGTATETNLTQIESADSSGNNATDEYRPNLTNWYAADRFYASDPVETGTADAFGFDSGTMGVGQAFVVPPSCYSIAGVLARLTKIGSPANMTLELRADAASLPGALLATATFTAAQVIDSSITTVYKFASPVRVVPGETLWFTFIKTGSASGTDYYSICRANSDTPDLTLARINSSAVWSGSSGTSWWMNVAHGPDATSAIKTMQAWINHGEDVSTNTKTGSWGANSNIPQLAMTWTYGDDVGALGTWPATWRWQTSTVEYTATAIGGDITDITGIPMPRIRKTDAGTRVASVDFMGVYMEYQPPPRLSEPRLEMYGDYQNHLRRASRW